MLIPETKLLLYIFADSSRQFTKLTIIGCIMVDSDYLDPNVVESADC